MAIATPAFSADIYVPKQDAMTCKTLADMRAITKAVKSGDEKTAMEMLDSRCDTTGAGVAVTVEDDMIDREFMLPYVCVRPIDSKGPCQWRIGTRDSLK
ncbi:hypothetical protein [Azorhizobium oxalatiphilum]|nr:hypothetical protein [Azorhizobium oxalatiphilum]